jgi:hypothetical protein
VTLIVGMHLAEFVVLAADTRTDTDARHTARSSEAYHDCTSTIISIDGPSTAQESGSTTLELLKRVSCHVQ